MKVVVFYYFLMNKIEILMTIHNLMNVLKIRHLQLRFFRK